MKPLVFEGSLGKKAKLVAFCRGAATRVRLLGFMKVVPFLMFGNKRFSPTSNLHRFFMPKLENLKFELVGSLGHDALDFKFLPGPKTFIT